MLSRTNSVIWIDDNNETDNQPNNNNNNNWFLQSSSSPTSTFQNTHPNHPLHFFSPPKPALPSTFIPISNYPLNEAFDFEAFNNVVQPNLFDFGSQSPIFPATGYPFEENESTGRSKLLRPLENFASTGSPPTSFQKRAGLRRDLNLSDVISGGEGVNEKQKKRKSGWDDVDDLSFDGSGLNYDSDELTVDVGDGSVGKSTVTGGGGGDCKGKKKGSPAKNLMAERRRRKKLNDRLYLLRSVVPKISKMDRASILGDAIEYLKELLKKINDLNHELEATPTSSLSATMAAGCYPLTPTPTGLHLRIKEELCATAIPSPTSQPATVEVRQREGRAVNIHMFCSRKPGLLMSTIRALDDLGLDIQQAVISCFNGFALDIFRAEQCKEGQDVHPDEVRAVLLESVGYHGVA